MHNFYMRVIAKRSQSLHQNPGGALCVVEYVKCYLCSYVQRGLDFGPRPFDWSIRYTKWWHPPVALVGGDFFGSKQRAQGTSVTVRMLDDWRIKSIRLPCDSVVATPLILNY